MLRPRSRRFPARRAAMPAASPSSLAAQLDALSFCVHADASRDERSAAPVQAAPTASLMDLLSAASIGANDDSGNDDFDMEGGGGGDATTTTPHAALPEAKLNPFKPPSNSKSPELAKVVAKIAKVVDALDAQINTLRDTTGANLANLQPQRTTANNWLETQSAKNANEYRTLELALETLLAIVQRSGAEKEPPQKSATGIAQLPEEEQRALKSAAQEFLTRWVGTKGNDAAAETIDPPIYSLGRWKDLNQHILKAADGTWTAWSELLTIVWGNAINKGKSARNRWSNLYVALWLFKDAYDKRTPPTDDPDHNAVALVRAIDLRAKLREGLDLADGTKKRPLTTDQQIVRFAIDVQKRHPAWGLKTGTEAEQEEANRAEAEEEAQGLPSSDRDRLKEERDKPRQQRRRRVLEWVRELVMLKELHLKELDNRSSGRMMDVATLALPGEDVDMQQPTLPDVVDLTALDAALGTQMVSTSLDRPLRDVASMVVRGEQSQPPRNEPTSTRPNSWEEYLLGIDPAHAERASEPVPPATEKWEQDLYGLMSWQAHSTVRAIGGWSATFAPSEEHMDQAMWDFMDDAEREEYKDEVVGTLATAVWDHAYTKAFLSSAIEAKLQDAIENQASWEEQMLDVLRVLLDVLIAKPPDAIGWTQLKLPVPDIAERFRSLRALDPHTNPTTGYAHRLALQTARLVIEDGDVALGDGWEGVVSGPSLAPRLAEVERGLLAQLEARFTKRTDTGYSNAFKALALYVLYRQLSGGAGTSGTRTATGGATPSMLETSRAWQSKFVETHAAEKERGWYETADEWWDAVSNDDALQFVLDGDFLELVEQARLDVEPATDLPKLQLAEEKKAKVAYMQYIDGSDAVYKLNGRMRDLDDDIAKGTDSQLTYASIDPDIRTWVSNPKEKHFTESIAELDDWVWMMIGYSEEQQKWAEMSKRELVLLIVGMSGTDVPVDDQGNITDVDRWQALLDTWQMPTDGVLYDMALRLTRPVMSHDDMFAADWKKKLAASESLQGPLLGSRKRVTDRVIQRIRGAEQKKLEEVQERVTEAQTHIDDLEALGDDLKEEDVANLQYWQRRKAELETEAAALVPTVAAQRELETQLKKVSTRVATLKTAADDRRQAKKAERQKAKEAEYQAARVKMAQDARQRLAGVLKDLAASRRSGVQEALVKEANQTVTDALGRQGVTEKYQRQLDERHVTRHEKYYWRAPRDKYGPIPSRSEPVSTVTDSEATLLAAVPFTDNQLAELWWTSTDAEFRLQQFGQTWDANSKAYLRATYGVECAVMTDAQHDPTRLSVDVADGATDTGSPTGTATGSPSPPTDTNQEPSPPAATFAALPGVDVRAVAPTAAPTAAPSDMQTDPPDGQPAAPARRSERARKDPKEGYNEKALAASDADLEGDGAKKPRAVNALVNGNIVLWNEPFARFLLEEHLKSIYHGWWRRFKGDAFDGIGGVPGVEFVNCAEAIGELGHNKEHEPTIKKTSEKLLTLKSTSATGPSEQKALKKLLRYNLVRYEYGGHVFEFSDDYKKIVSRSPDATGDGMSLQEASSRLPPLLADAGDDPTTPELKPYLVKVAPRFDQDLLKTAVDALLPTFKEMARYNETMRAARVRDLGRQQELWSVTSASMWRHAERVRRKLRRDWSQTYAVWTYWYEEAKWMEMFENGQAPHQMHVPQPWFLPLRVQRPPRVGKSATALLLSTLANRFGMITLYSVAPNKKIPMAELFDKLKRLGWFSPNKGRGDGVFSGTRAGRRDAAKPDAAKPDAAMPDAAMPDAAMPPDAAGGAASADARADKRKPPFGDIAGAPRASARQKQTPARFGASRKTKAAKAVEEAGQPPAAGEEPPAAGEEPPAAGEEPPAEGEEPPAADTPIMKWLAIRSEDAVQIKSGTKPPNMIVYSSNQADDCARIAAILARYRRSDRFVFHIRDEAQELAYSLNNFNASWHNSQQGYTDVPPMPSLLNLRAFYSNHYGLSCNVTATHFPTLLEEDLWGFMGSTQQLVANGVKWPEWAEFGLDVDKRPLGTWFLPKLVPALTPVIPPGYVGIEHLRTWTRDGGAGSGTEHVYITTGGHSATQRSGGRGAGRKGVSPDAEMQEAADQKKKKKKGRPARVVDSDSETGEGAQEAQKKKERDQEQVQAALANPEDPLWSDTTAQKRADAAEELKRSGGKGDGADEADGDDDPGTEKGPLVDGVVRAAALDAEALLLLGAAAGKRKTRARNATNAQMYYDGEDEDEAPSAPGRGRDRGDADWKNDGDGDSDGSESDDPSKPQKVATRTMAQATADVKSIKEHFLDWLDKSADTTLADVKRAVDQDVDPGDERVVLRRLLISALAQGVQKEGMASFVRAYTDAIHSLEDASKRVPVAFLLYTTELKTAAKMKASMFHKLSHSSYDPPKLTNIKLAETLGAGGNVPKRDDCSVVVFMYWPEAPNGALWGYGKGTAFRPGEVYLEARLADSAESAITYVNDRGITRVATLGFSMFRAGLTVQARVKMGGGDDRMALYCPSHIAIQSSATEIVLDKQLQMVGRSFFEIKRVKKPNEQAWPIELLGVEGMLDRCMRYNALEERLAAMDAAPLFEALRLSFNADEGQLSLKEFFDPKKFLLGSRHGNFAAILGQTAMSGRTDGLTLQKKKKKKKKKEEDP